MTRSNGKSQTQDPALASARSVPAVHRVIELLKDVDLPRPTVLAVVRRRLNALREGLSNDRAHPPVLSAVVEAARVELRELQRRRIAPVINATGIIIHTNLGRSPLSDRAAEAAMEAARNYVNLEYDSVTGERGGRAAYLEQNLALLCGGEGATLVNNCAAALVLVLRHFAARPPRNQVVISRGELVQIGGGFRVPEILESAGATLREVGTTNRTNLDDYLRAIDDGTAMILRVHRSNFYMGGFVETPTTGQLAKLARERDVPLVEDLGSGATFDTTTLGNEEREPTPAQSLAAGADLVTISGDKLLGGPQAGIIAGSARHIAALKREPLFRALRCEKLVLAAMQATVDALLAEKTDELPIRRMMNVSVDELRARAERIVAALGSQARAAVADSEAQVGGGSLPRTVLPSIAIELHNSDPEALAERLRAALPPVIGYITEGRVRLDLRTVFPRQDEQLAAALAALAVS